MSVENGVLFIEFEDYELELLANNPNEFWKGVKVISESAFKSLVEHVSELIIPEGVEKIDFDYKNEFGWYRNHKTSIKKISFPSTLKNIPDCLFDGCESLESISLEKGVETIGFNAFSGCKRLKKVQFPKGLKNISIGAFFGCNALKKVEIPEGCTLTTASFAFCKKLQEVVIGEGLTTLYDTFRGCENLQRVHLPDTLEKIDARVFENCVKLEEVNIPGSVTEIYPNAFRNCPNLMRAPEVPSKNEEQSKEPLVPIVRPLEEIDMQELNINQEETKQEKDASKEIIDSCFDRYVNGDIDFSALREKLLEVAKTERNLPTASVARANELSEYLKEKSAWAQKEIDNAYNALFNQIDNMEESENE